MVKFTMNIRSSAEITLLCSCILFAAYNAPKYSPSKDVDVFQHLALVYSRSHPEMHKGNFCPQSLQQFADGITNGAEWYPVTGK